MREIKFRAWVDEQMQKTLTIREIGLLGYEISDNAILMQYTGLEDKDGVDIYEGDYLLDGHSGGRGEVKFYKGAFIVEFDNEIQDLYDWTYECVIGNIYENPELLRED